MVICAICNKTIKTNQYIKCVTCDNDHHPTCAKVTDFRNLSGEYKLTWQCPQCLDNKNTGIPDSLELSSQPTCSDISTYKQQSDHQQHEKVLTPTDALNILPQLVQEIKFLRGDVCELKSHIKVLTDLQTVSNQRIEKTEAELVQARAKIQQLEEEVRDIPQLKSSVEQLRAQIQSQEQVGLNNQIEILGVNEAPGENLVHIALTAAAKIGVDLKDTDLDFVARAGPRRNNNNNSTNSEQDHPRPLVVKFIRRNKRNEFLRAGKTRRNISSKDLNVPGAYRTLYFNERLTKENRLLFRQAKLRAKEYGFKYCWVKNGNIYIRKQEGQPAINIKDTDDLLHHCNNPPNDTQSDD